jgi:hypothetical protein
MIKHLFPWTQSESALQYPEYWQINDAFNGNNVSDIKRRSMDILISFIDYLDPFQRPTTTRVQVKSFERIVIHSRNLIY